MLFPNFWLEPKFKQSFLPYLLYPISLFWLGLSKIKVKLNSSYQSPIPIICVGNLTVGGNGKTPTALKIRCLLKDLGYKPHILSRGYRARIKGPHLVDPLTDSFVDVGDEALLMASYGSTWISRNRSAGVKAAINSGADVIVLDDGYQNQSIEKNLSILVIETSIGFGNGYLIPAGPLRENISHGMKKADLIITIGDQSTQDDFRSKNPFLKEFPVIQARLKPKENTLNLKGEKVVAFAGIAHPSKFKATLENLGAIIISFRAFSNHKPFGMRQLNKLLLEAKTKKAILVTTQKDFVRIPSELQDNFKAIEVELEIDAQNFLLKKLLSIF